MFLQGNKGSMVVPADMQVSLQFAPTGDRILRMDRLFTKGEDAEEELALFMDSMRLHESLRLSTLSAMHTLIEAESRAASQLNLSRAEVDKGLKAWVDNFETRHAASNFVGAPIRTAKPDSPVQLHGPGTGSEDRRSVLKAFAGQFHELVHNSPDALQGVLAMERRYGDALADLMDEREAAMAVMQNRQAQEMEAVCTESSVSTSLGHLEDSMPQDPVAHTVMAHLEETEKYRKEWDDKFESVIQTQREEYRQEIDQLHTYLGVVSTPRFLPKQDEVTTTSFMYKQQEISSPSDDAAVAMQPEQKSSSFFNLFSRAGSRDSEPLAENRPEPDEVSSPKEVLREGGYTLFQCSYGKLRGPEYRVSTLRTTVEELMGGGAEPNEEETTDARVSTLLSLYSDELSGVVMLIDADMSHSSTSNKALVRKCQKSPELHFDTFNTQTQTVRTKTEQDGGLEPGDFWITQHSCLEHLHVVFHLAAGRNDCVYNPDAPDLDDKSEVLIGLAGILMAANQCGVASLVIPIMLLDEGWQQAVSTPGIALKRAEKVLERVMTFFNDYKGDDGSLRTIHFLVPSLVEGGDAECDEQVVSSFAEKCRGLVVKVFKRTSD
eukprot:TRINITY_DN14265_c0_g1_i17.p1 TRINITY_DN14265_c0_g1~~TRINITY_DN14265_c0_g1_i17.p1  ORF type:complete len:606 (+),score=169.77 TRINITY_DN14265_c0_g1_i17:62-1879(+)